MTVSESLYQLVYQLAESEPEIAQYMLTILKHKVDDDPVTEREMREIQRGARQVERGEFVALDELSC
jgi:hypothetical protein